MPAERPTHVGLVRTGVVFVLLIAVAWFGALVWRATPWSSDGATVSKDIAGQSIPSAHNGDLKPLLQTGLTLFRHNPRPDSPARGKDVTYMGSPRNSKTSHP